MGTLDSNRAAALNWVNDMRAQWGMNPLTELRPGVPNKSHDCALGRSLDGRAHFLNDGSCRVYAFGDEVEHRLPKPVAVFEADYERGYYGDLIAAGAAPMSYWRSNLVDRTRPTADDAKDMPPYAPVGDPEFMPR